MDVHLASAVCTPCRQAARSLAVPGLVLPGLARIQTRLTLLAALGLVFVMIGAAVWHLPRGEFALIAATAMAGLAVVSYGRWRLRPLKDRRQIP